MPVLTAKTNPIIVDQNAGAINGTTMIHYEKNLVDDLWHRLPGGVWTQPNLFVLAGVGTAGVEGDFPITLAPGEIYEIAIFEQNQGPTDDALLTRALKHLKVFCALKDPENRSLITDQKSTGTGGTWYSHKIATGAVPTSLMMIGVSRSAVLTDNNGVPHLVDPDGSPTAPLTGPTTSHEVELAPLLPGNHYFFAAVVIDNKGNWQATTSEFNTLRRQLTVGFPTIHIYNDGDPFTHGSADFWFRVKTDRSSSSNATMIEELHYPEIDIDDWSETDRPYAIGLAHLGSPMRIEKGANEVWVQSIGTEHDGIGEANEGAWSDDTQLPLLSGKGKENMSNAVFLMDCPTVTAGDDFHYGVDVIWSVSYVP